MPECVVGPTMTEHKFVKPFDRCACGQHLWPSSPPKHAPIGVLVSMTDEQACLAFEEAALRDLEYIFRDA